MQRHAHPTWFWVSVTVCLIVGAAQAEPTGPELAFPTGPLQFIEPATPAGRQALFTRDGFEKLLPKLRETPAFVGLPGDADAITTETLFGFNFVFGGNNHAFAVNGSAATGFVILADVNANGTMRDDAPLRTTERDGHHTSTFETTVTDTVNGESVTYPVRIRFDLSLIPTPTGARLGWATYNTAERTGTIQLADQRVAFTLIGRPGIFDQPGSRIWFDLDGNGQRTAEERFDVADKRITLGATSYAFAVDPIGRSVSLRPLAATVSNYSQIQAGIDAPEFSVTDIDRHVHSLASLRGKVVLLDFWAVWCGPCRIEAPLLNSLYEASHARGLEIVGIGPDSREEIVKFQAQFGYAWPQVSESHDGQTHRLYRVDGYPTHFLIGRDGKVVAVQLGGIDGTSFADAITTALERH